MSVRLSDYAIDEDEWMPNPYQEAVNSQMQQLANSWRLMSPTPVAGESHVGISDVLNVMGFGSLGFQVDCHGNSEAGTDVGTSDCGYSSAPDLGSTYSAQSGYHGGDSDAGSAAEFGLDCWGVARSDTDNEGNAWRRGSASSDSFCPSACSSRSWMPASPSPGETGSSLASPTSKDGEADEGCWDFLMEFASPDGEPRRHKERAELEGPDGKLSHLFVPRPICLEEKFSPEQDCEITTLMVRNIPNRYTRKMLMDELDTLGFQSQYDFIYLPMDKNTHWNVGYSFVNFVDAEAAKRCIELMTDYRFRKFRHNPGKVAQVSVAHIQGLQRNLDHYSHTAVQCARIQSHRPLVVPQDEPQPQPQPSSPSSGGAKRRSPRRRACKAPAPSREIPQDATSLPEPCIPWGAAKAMKGKEPCPEPSPKHRQAA